MTREPYIVAAHVQGTVASDDDLFKSTAEDSEKKNPADDDGAAEKPEKKNAAASPEAEHDPAEDPDAKTGPKENKINVVLVADIDWIAPIIFRLREMGENEDLLIDWKFQNVTMVLNILDSLANDDRFVAIRKRTRPHRILTKVEEATEEYREKSLKEQNKFISEASQQIETVRQDFRDKIAELENRTDLDPRMKAQVIEMQRIKFERERDVKIARLEKDRDKQVKQSERELAAKIQGVQNFYKLCAVFLPPIPPILLAFFVFFHRRRAEQEGVDTRRLRYGRAKDAA
jgi:ABC-2 type transport system permease protein